MLHALAASELGFGVGLAPTAETAHRLGIGAFVALALPRRPVALAGNVPLAPGGSPQQGAAAIPTGGPAVAGFAPGLFVDHSPQQVGGNVGQKTAGFLGFAAAPQAAPENVDEIEPPLGPGDAHVGQTPLLGHILLVAAFDAAGVGQNALFHPHHKNHRIFQPFGRVQGHQRHRVAALVDLIRIADQTHLLQKEGESVHSRFQTGHSRCILGGHPPQLLQVGEALFPFVGPVPQSVDVAGVLQDVIHQIGHAFVVVAPGHCHPIFQHLGKVDQRVDGAAAQPRLCEQPFVARGLGHPGIAVMEHPQAEKFTGAGLGGPILHSQPGFGPNASGWSIDDAVQRDGIGGVVDDPQIGQGVFHLHPLVETGGPHQPVAHVPGDECLFQRPALGIRPVHHRAVAQAKAPLGLQAGDLVADVGRLLHFVVGFVDHHLQPLAVVGEELLGGAVAVFGDHRIGYVQNRLGAAVVLLEQNRARVGVVPAELEDIAVVCAAEAVDGIVYDDAAGDVVAVGRHGEIVDRAGVLLPLYSHNFILHNRPVFTQHRHKRAR